MPRNLIASTDQLHEASKLFDQVGICHYRDAKAEAGLPRMKPFQNLTRLEAVTVIGILRQKVAVRYTYE
jgi:hypothetical protein